MQTKRHAFLAAIVFAAGVLSANAALAGATLDRDQTDNATAGVALSGNGYPNPDFFSIDPGISGTLANLNLYDNGIGSGTVTVAFAPTVGGTFEDAVTQALSVINGANTFTLTSPFTVVAGTAFEVEIIDHGQNNVSGDVPDAFTNPISLNGVGFANSLAIEYQDYVATPAAVPEPASVVLIGAGLAALTLLRRRRGDANLAA